MAIKEYAKSGVIEIGAGTGYWAWILKQVGVDVVALDKYPRPRWYEVQLGTEADAARFPDRALMLCWPPYADPMAAEALAAYQGDTLIYVGEDGGGCTGNRLFHQMLGIPVWDFEQNSYVCAKGEWQLTAEVDIPQWFGLHDTLKIYLR